MPITVLKNNVPWGPFSRAQIQEGLMRGDFTLQYLAHGPGLKQWLPLGEVLDHFDRSSGLPPVPVASAVPPAPYSREAERSSYAPPEPPPVSAPAPARSSGPPPMPKGREVPTAAVPPKVDPPPAAAPVPPPAKPAAFFPRFIAFVIDCGVLFLPVLFTFGLCLGTIEIQGMFEHLDVESMRQERALVQQNFQYVLEVVALGGAWLYAAGLECSRWQATVGKQWVGMKVTDAHGGQISFFRATGRHAAKFLSALPLFLGFTMALFSAQKLALHDRLAGTRVVKKERR